VDEGAAVATGVERGFGVGGVGHCWFEGRWGVRVGGFGGVRGWAAFRSWFFDRGSGRRLSGDVSCSIMRWSGEDEVVCSRMLVAGHDESRMLIMGAFLGCASQVALAAELIVARPTRRNRKLASACDLLCADEALRS
jgi:hypothetical protein